MFNVKGSRYLSAPFLYSKIYHIFDKNIKVCKIWYWFYIVIENPYVICESDPIVSSFSSFCRIVSNPSSGNGYELYYETS